MVVAVAAFNPHCPNANLKATRPLRKKKHSLVSENGSELVVLGQAPIIFQRELNEPQKSIAHGTVS